EKANEGGVQFETTHRRKDGSEFPVEVSATGVDIGGERMLISIVRDVNERKQAQEALIKAERKAAEEYQALLQRIVPLGQTLGTARDLISIYRAVLEFVRTSMSCSGFFISFYDSENRRRIAAYAWGEGAEVDISELPPMPLTEDGGPNSQAVFQKKTVIINHYWDEQKKRPHVILREDGVNPMSSLVVPMMVKNEVIGTLEVQAHENEAFREEQAIALGMAANLAAVAIENVRLLEVEANARRVAEDANRAKDEFLSVLSHELRTPLNAMLGWVKMLRAGMLDDNRTSQALEVIERNTRLQNNLIEDLLDVSRIISGKMRIEKELVDLKTLVQNSIEILRPAAANKNLEIEFTAQDDSPLIYGDETRLNQIVNNLVQNAVKFTPEGGKISIALKQNGSSTFLSVTDTGVGIERKFLPFIFDRFRQADASTKRSFSGLGLGLTIVRNLVELHGGGIKVESGGKGTGATFTVEIPLAEKFHLEESDADGEHTQPSDNFALKGMRILLVDDDRESLIPLQIFLEREKAEVVSVVSAKDALGKLSEQDFHILISDIGMPETDGYDLISQVREFTTERNAFLPAIALTAYASNEDRRRALSAGFQMHFSKPIDFDELAEAVKSLYKDLK
ncbi:MAG TPA: ATP-binding protein, partial [Pyrinomonadaceae bacterium]|nr:ATP-binding protein [Pyrinomonadaceae bacterium]